MSLFRTAAPQTVEVACTIEIEHTPESLHAHAVPEGVELFPGDRVLVHGAPGHVAFGVRLLFASSATVTRAGWLERQWTQFRAIFELAELYHVGFEPKEVA